MSTTTEGRAMRSFIAGRSDWPPARSFASGCAERVERLLDRARADVVDARRDHEAAARTESTIES